MKRILFASLALTASSICASAGAQGLEPIFEIPLGQPLAKPFASCADTARDRTDWCASFGSSSRAPAKIYLTRPPVDTPRKIPSWIKSGLATVQIDAAGVVSEILVTTVGPDRQSDVIESVEGRFGKPTALDKRLAKNAYGATWPVTKAEWTLPAIRISHDCYQRDECVLIIQTPEEAARQEAQRANQREKDRM